MGMITNAMPQGAMPPAPAATAAPAGAPPAARKPVDPVAVQKLVLAGMNALYKQGAIDHAIQLVQSAQPPSKGLAEVCYHLLQSIYQRANGSIEPNAMAPAAQQIVTMVADSCTKAGVQIGKNDIAMAIAMMLMQAMHTAGMDTSALEQFVEQGGSGQDDAEPADPAAPGPAADPTQQPAQGA